MKRNSTTLFLESPGAITPLPWANNEPDFTGFTEPTLSVLQVAWSDFLASGESLEVVPDPELSTPEPVVPDWMGFNIAMNSNGAWDAWDADLRAAGGASLRAAEALVSTAANSNLSGFQVAYQLAKTVLPPTLEAISEWQGIADAHGIDIVL